MRSERNSDRVRRVRDGVRQRTDRNARARRVARTSSERGFEGCREARDRADRDDVRARPRPADRLGQERFRHAEQPTGSGLRRYHRTQSRFGPLRPETKEARSLLQRSVAATLERFWPADGVRRMEADPKISPVEALYDKIEALSPQSEAQRAFRSQAEAMGALAAVRAFGHVDPGAARSFSSSSSTDPSKDCFRSPTPRCARSWLSSASRLRLHLLAGSGNDADPKIALFALHSAAKGERHHASALDGNHFNF
jgi:hypothetical protein